MDGGQTVSLTPAQVRRIHLHAQGLGAAQAGTATTEDVLCAIRRMHSLQIDTISVIARSQHLVLWSRIGDFEPALLDQLLAERRIFEHWSRGACFMDIGSYPVYRRMILDRQRRGEHRWYAWMEAHQSLVDRVLEHIREHGPVRSAEFARPDGRKGNGWWDWKDEKLALEMLLVRGDVMVVSRSNFQRLYDLRERVLPEWDDAETPDLEQAHRRLALDAVLALGIGRADWVRDCLLSLAIPLQAIRRRLQALVAEGHLIEVAVKGSMEPAYIHPANVGLLERARDDTLPPAGTALLSPFDPIVRDRKRAQQLFGFDYRIECYTPAAKRKYGYFTLPVLHGDGLVGRLDPKAHRRDGIFEVKSLHMEPDVEITDELVAGLRDTLHRLASWHRTPEVVVREANVSGLAEALA